MMESILEMPTKPGSDQLQLTSPPRNSIADLASAFPTRMMSRLRGKGIQKNSYSSCDEDEFLY